MQSDRFTFSEIDLASAVRGLREALGRSAEVMARILGCSLPAYQKWELGSAIPSGEWLLRMLQLCPDEETRNAFRIRAERRGAAREKSEMQRTGRLTQEERQRTWRVAREAVDALYECGGAGVEAADNRLLDFAENMRSAADYYQAQLKRSHDLAHS
jgi:transcriptional regulator with XRE-family HTH domain